MSVLQLFLFTELVFPFWQMYVRRAHVSGCLTMKPVSYNSRARNTLSGPTRCQRTNASNANFHSRDFVKGRQLKISVVKLGNCEVENSSLLDYQETKLKHELKSKESRKSRNKFIQKPR